MGVEVLDPQRRILLLTRPRLIGRFKLTDRIVVQAFSRRPNAEDAERFHQWLRERKMIFGPERRRTYDLAVMIGPSPTASRGRGDWDADRVTGVQSSDAGSLVSALNRAAANSPRSPDGRELLLFAAMGPGQGAVQEFRDAVNDVATFWLGQGGRIRFGGHPTVTATVNWVASTDVPGRERDHVVIYQSEFFVTPQLLAEVSSIATVVGTPVRGEGDSQRAQSLTHMRELMIGGSSAVAAIVVGGRTYAESGRPPGIEEEVQIARRQGVPVYVLGAAGGEAALVAERLRQQNPPFADLGNQLSSAENEFLATTDDYTAAAQLIWTTTWPSE